MKVLGWIVAFVGIFVLGPIWSGYILSVLWTWFMIPAFHLPQISIALAIGVTGVVRMLTFQIPSEQDKKNTNPEKVMARILGWSFVYPLIALAFGYIVHLFV